MHLFKYLLVYKGLNIYIIYNVSHTLTDIMAMKAGLQIESNIIYGYTLIRRVETLIRWKAKARKQKCAQIFIGVSQDSQQKSHNKNKTTEVKKGSWYSLYPSHLSQPDISRRLSSLFPLTQLSHFQSLACDRETRCQGTGCCLHSQLQGGWVRVGEGG